MTDPVEKTNAPSARTRVELTDARQMRAVAHPLRLALIGLLRGEGPMTASDAGERLGQSSGSMSFHLRQLAKHGLVEETGDGVGRRKPWRATAQFTTWSDAPTDPELGEATALLRRVLAARYGDNVQRWIDQQPSEPDEWNEAAQFGDSLLWLTAEELSDLGRALTDLLRPYEPRLTDPAIRPDGARPVSWLHLTFPSRPT